MEQRNSSRQRCFINKHRHASKVRRVNKQTRIFVSANYLINNVASLFAIPHLYKQGWRIWFRPLARHED